MLPESIGAQPVQQPTPVTFNQENGVVRAAAILTVGNVTSRILGLAREVVKANLFGASGPLAAFEAAALVPTTLFDLIIGGIVSSALVPVFSDYVTDLKRRDELWLVVSTVLSIIIALLLLVVGVVELFTSQIAGLVGAYGFEDPSLTTFSIRLMRMTTPAVIFLGTSSILTAALLALNRFSAPAFTAATFNGAIVVVVLLNREIEGLVWGLLAGSLLQVVIQLPALRDARLRWRFDWRHPALRRIVFLYAPIVAGLLVDQFARAVSYNLAIRTGDASLTYMRWATTLFQLPLGLVVTALSLAILPTLSRQAGGALSEFKVSLSGGLRLVIVLIMPAAVGLFALSEPIVALLFEHGEFTRQDTLTTALVLRYYLIGLPFAAVDQILVISSYARQDTWRPALAGVISVLIYTFTAVLLLDSLGLLSLMVADATKHVVHTIMMIGVLRRHVGSFKGYGIGLTLLKSVPTAAVTGLVALVVANAMLSSLSSPTFANRLVSVAAAGLAGFLTFALLSSVLGIAEPNSLFRFLRKPRQQQPLE
jgi:putative peptidoglycan lipid II flippase